MAEEKDHTTLAFTVGIPACLTIGGGSFAAFAPLVGYGPMLFIEVVWAVGAIWFFLAVLDKSGNREGYVVCVFLACAGLLFLAAFLYFFND